MISNPACDVAGSGCGVWQAPTIKNPLFKGIWKCPKIDNPAYKGIKDFIHTNTSFQTFILFFSSGIWAPRKIPNENYFEDLSPYNSLAALQGLAVEVWTINAGIFFDNFLVADSLEAAFALADASFAKKVLVENKKEKKEKKEQTKSQREQKKKVGTAREKAEVHLSEVVEIVGDYFGENMWVVIASVGAMVVSLLVFLMLPAGKSVKRSTTTNSKSADVDADIAEPVVEESTAE